MLKPEFIRSPVTGLEFLDWQNDNFFNELTELFNKHIENNVLSESFFADDAEIKTIIEKYTGFSNIKLIPTKVGNLAIDTGYIAPNSIINNKLVDEFISHTKTQLYKSFKEDSEKVFKGSIDYTSGKVSGGFSTLPFELYINVNLNSYLPPKLVSRFNATLAELMAGVLAHELGHAFSGCMLLHTTVKDNMLLKAGLRAFKEVHTNEERFVILRDTKNLLDIKEDDKTLSELSKSSDENTYVLYYSKMLTRRNNNRALSLGVTEMTSEVLADMYAIRMGCGKGILAAINVLASTSKGSRLGVSLVNALVVTLLSAGLIIVLELTIIELSLLVGLIGFIGTYFSRGFSGIYNADHRRLEDGIRQLIAKLKEDKNLKHSEKQLLVNEIQTLLKEYQKIKPWYENTIIRRLMGRVFQGGDFKYVEMEHFTSVLQNHEVNLLSGQFNTAQQV